jgi:hypothetical protein
MHSNFEYKARITRALPLKNRSNICTQYLTSAEHAKPSWGRTIPSTAHRQQSEQSSSSINLRFVEWWGNWKLLVWFRGTSDVPDKMVVLQSFDQTYLLSLKCSWPTFSSPQVASHIRYPRIELSCPLYGEYDGDDHKTMYILGLWKFSRYTKSEGEDTLLGRHRESKWK